MAYSSATSGKAGRWTSVKGEGTQVARGKVKAPAVIRRTTAPKARRAK